MMMKMWKLHYRAPGWPIVKKMAQNKMFLEFNLRGVYFMQKCQIPKLLFDPLWTNTFGGALELQGSFK
jgi:hypothetical protein